MKNAGNLTSEDLTEFFAYIAELKQLKRKGWVERGVRCPESVAAHSFGVAALAAIAASVIGVDPARAVLIAIIHDIAEALTGDLTPADGVSLHEKHQKEEQAARKILGKIDQDGTLMDAWLDYTERRTPEGQLVKDIDILDMALQADIYSKAGTVAASELRRAAEPRIQSPALRALLGPRRC